MGSSYLKKLQKLWIPLHVMNLIKILLLYFWICFYS